ncbi:MAG TPA: serine hydrolase domain-containing protein [Kofleriaceae bacterium]|jgi:CubicO group peptidase (beta-lactamase class C family)
MSRVTFVVAAAALFAACLPPSHPKPKAAPPDPLAAHALEDGPHKAAVAAQVQPFIDGEIAQGIVIGLYDAGKVEIYGFGKGPNGKPPDGTTLFEIGSVTKVYTALLLADATQRREVELDGPLAELMPPGVTVPTVDRQSITLKMLALHTSGLPRIPPRIQPRLDGPDPYAGYSEDFLLRDLIAAKLGAVPGSTITYSEWGYGILGYALGKKLGGDLAKVITDRLLAPLGLKSTYFVVPPDVAARRAVGTNDDLAQARSWSWDALAGAGAMVSDAQDQLRLIDAELDAAAGGQTTLRHALKLTQEQQTDGTTTNGANETLGWQIDHLGRFWHNGSTGGFHAFVGFDTKSRRGVVILSSTATTLVDRLANSMYDVMDGTPAAPPHFPTADQLTPLVGTYDFSGQQLRVTQKGRHLYVEGPGEPPHRLSPLSDHEFWVEAIEAVCLFEAHDGKITAMHFNVGGRDMSAARVN